MAKNASCKGPISGQILLVFHLFLPSEIYQVLSKTKEAQKEAGRGLISLNNQLCFP